MSHGVIVCERCTRVIQQCRCMEVHSVVRRGLCESCRMDAERPKPFEWTYFLSAMPPLGTARENFCDYCHQGREKHAADLRCPIPNCTLQGPPPAGKTWDMWWKEVCDSRILISKITVEEICRMTWEVAQKQVAGQ